MLQRIREVMFVFFWLLVAAIGAMLAYNGFQAWEHNGFAWPRRGALTNDGSFAAFVIGVIISIVALLTLALSSGRRNKSG